MVLHKIKARQIFDCRGEPTLEVDVITEIGIFSTSVPSTVSINPNQAQEIRDEKMTSYHGRSVFKAVDNVNNVIAPALIKSKLNVSQQVEIDKLLNKLDGTKNKSKLGVNAILGVSVGCCKAGAAEKGLPSYRFLLIRCLNQFNQSSSSSLIRLKSLFALQIHCRISRKQTNNATRTVS